MLKISDDGEFSVKKPSTIGKDWEKINFWRGKALLGKTSYSDFTVDSDLPAKIPVAFLSGYYDYTTPITLSKEL